MKHRTSIAAALLLLMFLLSNTCTAYAAENLTLKRTAVALGLGEKAACIQFNNSRIHPTDCTYRSADTSVLAVSKSGVVTAKKIGTAKVTVRYRRQTAACTVTVKAAPTKLAVKGGDVVIQKGANNHKIKLQFARGTAAYTVTYKTRDSAIATVNKQGYITGKANGKTQLTVRTYNGVTAQITVRVQNKALPLNANAAQLALDHNHVTQVVYGKSVQNRNLEGYIITPTNGKYKKTLFIDFAIHGFEDDYARDGQRLTAIANHLIAHFASHPEELGNYRLVIVPCANPDGAIAGKNAQRSGKNAFGRCTAAHIDINRDFGPFKGKETRALRDFILRSKPNVYINAHGWLNETLGTKKLCQIVNRTLHLNKMKDGVYAANEGYAIGWVHKKLNIPCCLLEYKAPNALRTKDNVRMIREIIKAYA